MLLLRGQGGGLNAGLGLWLPFDDLGGGAVDTTPAYAAGSPTATFTRATTATTILSNGLIGAVSSGVARSCYSPAGVYLGALIEPQSTNLLLNSKLDGTNLSTQTVAVTAQAYTLSFYGAGSITLSGASTAGPLNGSGAYPARVTLTFTPSAGNLTLTVAGTVQYAQLEAGSAATSFIPTAGASVTRAADVLQYPTSGNALGTEGACYAEATWATGSGGCDIVSMHNSAGGGIALTEGFSGGISMFDGTTTLTTGPASSSSAPSIQKVASKWSAAASACNAALNGTLGTSQTFDGDMNFDSVIQLMGRPTSGSYPRGTIKNVKIWTRALSDSQLVSLTS